LCRTSSSPRAVILMSPMSLVFSHPLLLATT
jgi:hypothetical protein